MKKYFIIIFSALFLIQCSKEEKSVDFKEKQSSNQLILTESQLNNISIETVILEEKSIAKTQLLTAKTEVSPQNTVSITSPFGGYVSRISLIPGSRVNKGQVVVVLEDPQYIQMQEDYLTTKVLLEQASADYNRQRDLNAEQAASDKVMQQAKANKNTLLVKKSALEQKLRLMNINPSSVSINNIRRTMSVYAPISGIVSEVFSNTGQYISPSDAMLEIVNPTNALLVIKVFQKDLDGIKVGQSLKAFSNAEPKKKIDASIVSISNQVNEDGTLDVFAKLSSNVGLHYTSNLYYNVELELESSSSNVLPEESVVEFEGKNYVFYQESKLKFTLIPVVIGSSSHGFVEIISPQLTNKQIVSKGAYALLTALKNSSDE